MQSLGIDLSTDPKKVWLCEIDWGTPDARVVALDQVSALPDPRVAIEPGGERPIVRDEAGLVALLVERLAAFEPSPDRLVGIDAPFGWPVAFVDAVSNWEAGDLQGFRKLPEMRLRATDRFVQTVSGITPLSVSVDRIGSTAMLCAEVLSRFARRLDQPRLDRARALDGLTEVYPSAALRMWAGPISERLRAGGYKTDATVREALVRDLTGVVRPLALQPDALEPEAGHVEAVQLPGHGAAGVVVPPAFCSALVENDDAFDAFVCALVARAAAIGQCHGIERSTQAEHVAVRSGRAGAASDAGKRVERARALQLEASEHADAEGWIHLPLAGPIRASLGLPADSGARSATLAA